MKRMFLALAMALLLVVSVALAYVAVTGVLGWAYPTPVYAQSRVAQVDETTNRLTQHIIGNKGDTAATDVDSTTSLMAYAKGTMQFSAPAASTGVADIDVSAADYTGFQTLLTVQPNTGVILADVRIAFDWNKATTGWDKVATAADTLDSVVVSKVDGTNWRTRATGTQVTANGDGTLDDSESGQEFSLGLVGAEGARVKVKVSAERGDVEIPYRVTYRGSAAPTVTAVAAGS